MSAPTSPGRPYTPSDGAEASSVHREAATFVAAGAVIIFLAHGVEVSVAGAANWRALAIRVVWSATLLVVAALFRGGSHSTAITGAAVGIYASAGLHLALMWVTGRFQSPLLQFTPVLATVLPFVAFDALWIGLSGSSLLLFGTGLIMFADGAPAHAFIALANAGGGALACGWLLARAFERSRLTEVRRRAELAEAMASIRTLKGLLPVCSWCRRVRTDAGYWEQMESYISAHTEATFTHGLCRECEQQHFSEFSNSPMTPTQVPAGKTSGNTQTG